MRIVEKAKLSIFKTGFVAIITYGHESWLMAERMQVQASKMRFLQRIEEVKLFNKVRSSEIRKSFNIDPLLLRVERSQLGWFGHVSRMPQERFPNKLYLPKQMGEDQLNDLELEEPITLRVLDGIAWNFTQTKWWTWWKTVKCGGLSSSCCSCNPHGKAGNKERRKRRMVWIDNVMIVTSRPQFLKKTSFLRGTTYPVHILYIFFDTKSSNA